MFKKRQNSFRRKFPVNKGANAEALKTTSEECVFGQLKNKDKKNLRALSFLISKFFIMTKSVLNFLLTLSSQQKILKIPSFASTDNVEKTI